MTCCDTCHAWHSGLTAEQSNCIESFQKHALKITYTVMIFTARAYVRAVLGVVILSVRSSVCPSVTRVHCDKTK